MSASTSSGRSALSMTARTATTAVIRASDRRPSVAGERGAEVGLTTTRRYDRNHRAVLEDQAGLCVVVLAHAASDQPARHRERVLARGERAVVHPRIVRARPGAAARAGTKSSARLHAKHSHVTVLPQEPCPGPPGACYDASQPRRCEAGRGERDGEGRTRIPFRHAPVPGWACYATAWACRHSRSAFEARRPLLRRLGVVGTQLQVEVRKDGHELDEVLGIAAVVVAGTRS